MPKGPALKAAERDEIRELRAAGMSSREIAKRLDRSKTVVLNYLRNPTQYGTIKRSGRKRALSPEQEAQIYAALMPTTTSGAPAPVAPATATSDNPETPALTKMTQMSAERLRRELNLPLSTRRIQQLLSAWRRQARKAQDQQQGLKASAESSQEITGASAVPPQLPPVDLLVMDAGLVNAAPGAPPTTSDAAADTLDEVSLGPTGHGPSAVAMV